MKKNDVVKFKEPADEAESMERFVLLEDPDGGRVLVQGCVAGWAIQPTRILSTDDLECI